MKYSKLSDYKIKKLQYCFCSDIDATKTALILGLNRKTVNAYFHLFRALIYEKQQADFKFFFGEVECDEAYFGSSRIRGKKMPKKKGRGTLKQPVFGILERQGLVYTELINNAKASTLRQIILGKINPESLVFTDEWKGYSGLVDVGYGKHFRINKSKHFSDGKGVHINGIESFWSFTKRRLAKFNGVKKYFVYHLKESEWRWGKEVEELKLDLSQMIKKHNFAVRKKNLAKKEVVKKLPPFSKEIN